MGTDWTEFCAKETFVLCYGSMSCHLADRTLELLYRQGETPQDLFGAILFSGLTCPRNNTTNLFLAFSKQDKQSSRIFSNRSISPSHTLHTLGGESHLVSNLAFRNQLSSRFTKLHMTAFQVEHPLRSFQGFIFSGQLCHHNWVLRETSYDGSTISIEILYETNISIL